MAGILEGKVALITGAGSGIGRATAKIFAREGAKLVLADVVEDGGKQTLAMVADTGKDAIFVKTDVSKQEDVDALIAKAVEVYGRIDCAFNNAGIEGKNGLTHECERDNWDRVIAINLTGVWLCMKAEIAQMLKQGKGGAVVNTSSGAGLVGFAGQAAYVASKHGVNGLTKVAALDYGARGIRVNAICPGTARTPMVDAAIRYDPSIDEQLKALHPIGRIGEASEIAEAAVWLCSPAASFVLGVALPVDGGYVVP